MREVDDWGRTICAFQGHVFQKSAELLGNTGSAVFVRRFMRSQTARRIDACEAIWEGAQPQDVTIDVDAEYGGKPYGREIYPCEVLYWMGYLYRYGCLATGLSSKELYSIVGARELRDLYFAYHSLDPAQCIERILEAKHVAKGDDSLQRGVVALRRIRNERSRRG